MSSTPRRDDGTHRLDSRGATEVEAYEDDGTVVFFDAANPLAWVEARASRTVRLADAM